MRRGPERCKLCAETLKALFLPKNTVTVYFFPPKARECSFPQQRLESARKANELIFCGPILSMAFENPVRWVEAGREGARAFVSLKRGQRQSAVWLLLSSVENITSIVYVVLAFNFVRFLQLFVIFFPKTVILKIWL